MTLKSVAIWSALACLAAATACEKSPAQPTSVTAASTEAATSTTDARTGVTLTSPVGSSPANNAEIKFGSQPITLVVTNGVTSGSAPLTYTFEVASDAAFQSIAQTKSDVAQGTGQTSVVIDKLGGNKVYYWRARTKAGSTEGPNSRIRAFAIGPEVVLQTPSLGDPAPNATVGTNPTLNVNNVGRSGPAGQIIYRFDVSEQPDFSAIVFSGTADERGDLPFTPLTVTTQLSERTYFWRVQAIDQPSGATSDYSGASSFQVQAFDMRNATIWDNPADLGSWAETAHITSIQFTDSAFLVDFDKRTGAGRWPDVGFGAGSLEYTLGMCVNIGGEWNCSATVQFWSGRDLAASGRPDQIGINWWYDGRWGRLIHYQPSFGETVGIFVAAGNLRDRGNVITKERSNVVLMPFGGTYALSAASRKAPFFRR
jgi:hypothetical protein